MFFTILHGVPDITYRIMKTEVNKIYTWAYAQLFYLIHFYDGLSQQTPSLLGWLFCVLPYLCTMGLKFL